MAGFLDFLKRTGAAGLASLPAACAGLNPSPDSPARQIVQPAFAAADSPLLAPGAAPQSRWWTQFADPALEDLIATVDSGNLSLEEAEARIVEAEARLELARTGLLPGGGASAAYSRQQQGTASFEASGFPGAGMISPGAIDLYTLGTDASWEIDLFGRIRGGIEQARAGLAAARASRADLQRVLVGEAASAWYNLMEIEARRAIAEEAVARQEDVLELTRQLVEAGERARLDIRRQEALVANTRASLAALRSARADAVSGLAVLAGLTVPQFEARFAAKAADDARARVEQADAEPIAIGEPSGLIRRRPDVRAAEMQLRAAAAGVRLAAADLYPSLSLSGSASLSATSVSGLGDDGAFGYSFGPRLNWGLFNYPRTLAGIDLSEAEFETAAVRFEQVVLEALTETDGALRRYNGAVEEAVHRRQALSASRETLRLVNARYEAGADSLLSLLDAQREFLSAEDAAATAAFSVIRARIAVHRSLGG